MNKLEISQRLKTDNKFKKIRRYLFHKIFNKSKQIRIDNSIFYLPMAEDNIQRHIIVNRNYFERKRLDFIRSLIDANSIFVDIGANIGNHTLYFLNELKASKIYCFEPQPIIIDILRENKKLNDKDNAIIINNIGLGKSSDLVGMEINPNNNLGASRIDEQKKGHIVITTLDSFHIPRIDLLKIDVESYELKVLIGAIETIRRCKPKIWIEIDGNNYNDVYELLDELGYKLLYKLENTDYIFVPKEKER